MEATAAGSKPLLAANNIVSNGGVSRRVSGKNTKPDQKDFENMQVTVEFKLEAPDAKAVCVAGTFNNWEPNGTPLKQNGARWKATMSLPRGNYEYRFVVDDQWLPDPAAIASTPNPFGGVNSVLSL